MPLPKQRISKRRRDFRRSHHALSLPTLAPCPQCRQPRLPHRVCPNCGQYRGREVIVHVLSGNVFGAKKGRGENVNWDELDPKKYPAKADIVAAFQKSIADCNATLPLAPEDARLYRNRAEAYKNKGEHDKASADWAEAQRLDPQSCPPPNKPWWKFW